MWMYGRPDRKSTGREIFYTIYDKAAVCRLAKEKGLYEKYPYFYGEMPLDMMLYADTMAGDDTSDNGKLHARLWLT